MIIDSAFQLMMSQVPARQVFVLIAQMHPPRPQVCEPTQKNKQVLLMPMSFTLRAAGRNTMYLLWFVF